MRLMRTTGVSPIVFEMSSYNMGSPDQKRLLGKMKHESPWPAPVRGHRTHALPDFLGGFRCDRETERVFRHGDGGLVPTRSHGCGKNSSTLRAGSSSATASPPSTPTCPFGSMNADAPVRGTRRANSLCAWPMPVSKVNTWVSPVV